ncbi:STAS domain-containing protein [Marinobacter sp. M216]|uniref:STAS domain-containing protein n=1 Tax=Marinobacter albus TaxID=3030833 RepID=A0ABT7HA19_9GAMM|nr:MULTISPECIES: STAS domain-containing protein [unclassified Marinobacter]MBW7470524.1 STAS domain-containing protein [Marinobacter sp. F4218]MDK9557208.1 STAS domain-containing protein [Marinobacter sp. M216]
MTAPAPRVEMIDSVLTVSGEVDGDSVVALRKQGETLLNTVNVDLVVDLGTLKTASSVVLSLLLCWQRLANRRGVSLSYRGVSERLASLAALSNLDDQLSGFSSGSA